MPMSPNDVILRNMPEGIRKEKMVCPDCGNIVQKNNYCEVCDCKLPG